MSPATTTTAALPTATNCGAKLYEIPTTDAACAVPAIGNYSEVMHQCCKVASVENYNNGCGLYCLAQEQSVGDLSSCLTSNGIKYGDAFCNHNQTATATAKVSGSTSTSTATKTGSAASATASGAAPATIPQQSLSKSGLGILALLFCSTVAGAFV
ncbi:hypothetical protein VTN02DRAFT_4576 [Thermoascus thermophilus]